MKKRSIAFATTVAILAVSITVFTSFLIKNRAPYIDKNGKLVGGTVQAPENSAVLSRDERISLLQEEKEEFDRIGKHSAVNETGTMSPEELSVFDAMQKEAEVEIEIRQKLFSDGLKIVNKYSKVKYDENITDIEYINRDILAEMVTVIKRNNLNTQEITTLKMCLTDMFVIVLPEDSLYGQIEAILKK